MFQRNSSVVLPDNGVTTKKYVVSADARMGAALGAGPQIQKSFRLSMINFSCDFSAIWQKRESHFCCTFCHKRVNRPAKRPISPEKTLH